MKTPPDGHFRSLTLSRHEINVCVTKMRGLDTMVTTRNAGPGRSVSRAGVIVGLLAAVLLVGGVLVVSTATQTKPKIDPKVDQNSAVTLARQFFDGAYGAKATVSDVSIEGIVLDADPSGRPAWRVTIDGDVVAGGGTARTSMVLLVDADSGAITIVAQR